MSSQNEFIVRPAGMSDLETILNFNTALALETEGRMLQKDLLRRGTLAVLDSHDKGRYLVAEAPQSSGTQVIGQLLITNEWSDWRNGMFWWIQSVYVHQAWRRRGVYRTMHQYVLREAETRKNVCGIRLYVEESNQAAQAVYRRVGLSPSSYRVFEKDFVLPRKDDGAPPSL